MNNKLYPIGTQLYTTDLETAAGYVKRFRDVNIETWQQQCSQWWEGFYRVSNGGWSAPEKGTGKGWRITVTPENQKLLSPVPIVGDLCVYKEEGYGVLLYITAAVKLIERTVNGHFIVIEESIVKGLKVEEVRIDGQSLENITERDYNGQPLPFLGGWDEVKEPESESL